MMSAGDAPSSGKDAIPMLVVMKLRPCKPFSSLFKVRWIRSATNWASFFGVEGSITQNSVSPNRPTRSISRSDAFSMGDIFHDAAGKSAAAGVAAGVIVVQTDNYQRELQVITY